MQAFFGYFFKTQGRQNSTFFKTQAIFLQNSRKISQNSIFRKFLSLWAFFKYSQWSKNEVILTILLHNIECTALTSQSFYSVSAKLNRNSTFFKNSRYFLWKLKEISAQNSIFFAKLNFSEIPFPYDGAKTAKKKAWFKFPSRNTQYVIEKCTIYSCFNNRCTWAQERRGDSV